MSHFSLERKRAAVAVFRHAKKRKTEYGAKWVSPVEFAQIAAGGVSPSQIYTWLRSDFSNEAEEQHQERRGASAVLTENQVSLLVGFACFVRTSLKPLNRTTLQQFCTSHLGKTLSLSTISRIMNEHRFSSQRSMSRNSRMVTEDVVDDALDAIVELRSYGFCPDQLLFMDETGLWSNVAAPCTYHFVNWYVSRSSLHMVLFAVVVAR